MRAPEVSVVSTGTANRASVMAALERVGARPSLAASVDDVVAGERVVLPGVGTFSAAAGELDRQGLTEVLAERIEDERPTLAICLGMQLFAKASDESPGVRGLGILDLTARAFPAGVRRPQLGWNRIEPDAGCALLSAGEAYFANSYRIEAAPAGWGAAVTEHGTPFVAALERGPVLACQFHPELSGSFGLDLIRRWLTLGA